MIARSVVLGVSSTALLCLPATSHASDQVHFASDVFVERFVTAPEGRASRILERADRLTPGDRVIFIVSWTAARARTFTVTNPMPRAIAFQRSGDGEEEVSVDGGRNWGSLGELQVRDRDGNLRMASPEDVTHLRWRVPGTRGSGQLTYRGVVR